MPNVGLFWPAALFVFVQGHYVLNEPFVLHIAGDEQACGKMKMVEKVVADAEDEPCNLVSPHTSSRALLDCVDVLLEYSEAEHL